MLDLGNFSIPILLACYVALTCFASILINGLLLKFSLSLGMKNDSSQVRWAAASKPAFGGISFYIKGPIR